MANIYNFSRNALLKRIGLTPGKKLLVFLISLVALTIPLGYVYNSVAVIFFVACSILSARRQDFSLKLHLVLPAALFVLMLVSVLWSLTPHESLKALGKEAGLFFIPIAFMLNRRLNSRGVNDILKNFSLGMCIIGAYFLIRAVVRYIASGNVDVFFYHELATIQVNAVYLSVVMSMAFVVFLAKKGKTLWGYAAMGFLLLLIFLLSSKNLIIIDIALVLLYYIFYSQLPKKARVGVLLAFTALVLVMGYSGRIYERILHETQAASHDEQADGIHYVTISEAATRKQFNENCYFNGTAFRTYQARIFTEMLQEDPIFFTGYGLNASAVKVEQKGLEHNIYHKNDDEMAYNKLNFHNQYVQVFADLGIFGFLIVVIMLAINLKKGLQNKYFIHIAFAILMISVFLTESFLWRQRGVVLFSIFYCLFNDMLPFVAKRKPNENDTYNGSGRISGLTSL
ncbi:O-antigen ligase family protein [Flavobacterium sp. RHBU_24]|uniref:O-antigen ligase family protein n=1 Tax=Flavobacterium sp. RHBU_24 TaxID=3391185 RepID=UPI00398516F9